MAFRLGKRLAGPVAGVIAAGALFLADEFIRNFFRGNSEGILVAALPVGGRAPPRRPPPRRLPARPRRRAAAPRGVALHRALRPLPDRRRLAPEERAAGQDHGARDRRRPRARDPVVPARVPRLGRLPARRRARPQAEPGQRRVRRPPVRRGLPTIGLGAVNAGLRRRRAGGDRRHPRLREGAQGGPVPRDGGDRDRPDGRRGRDDAGRVRRQPALRRAARRARMRARRGRLGMARPHHERPLRCRRRDRARGRHRRRERALRDPGRRRTRHGRPAHQGRGRSVRHGSRTRSRPAAARPS